MRDRWLALIEGFAAGRLGPAAFHDAFFALWHEGFEAGHPVAVERLFPVVEAYEPDPALRDTAAPWAADEAELREAAGRALSALIGEA